MSAITSAPASVSPAFLDWLDGIVARFHNAHRVVPFRPKRFLTQVQTVAQLTVGACRLFAASNVTPDQIELCRDRARQMYQEFAGALQYTYITPIDSEDMQRLVLRFLHLLDLLGDCTHVLASMADAPRELGPVQEKLIGCASALADSIDAMVAGTSLVEPTTALWEQQRSAYLQWRHWRTAVRNRNLPPIQMLQMDTLLRPLARLIREFRQAAIDIREVKLKNG